MYALSRPIREQASSAEASFRLYGQSAALAEELPAAHVIEQLVRETKATLQRLLMSE
jgi:hypothetical protein